MKYAIFIIIFIILLNVGFSYKYFSSMFYGDSFDGITSEISELFSDKKYEYAGMEFLEIVDLLKKQPGIENSYVMSDLVNYAYYSGSKFLYTDFRSGQSSDSINDFIHRKNWSGFDLYISNIHSYPRDKHGLLEPIPDYIIYHNIPYDDNNPHYQKPSTYFDISVLGHPDNEEIPSNFELLYKSNKTSTVIYKIHNNEN